MSEAPVPGRQVLALINPRSGPRRSFDRFREALDRIWDVPGVELTYQFCQSVEDAVAKTERAVGRGVDTILVAGGDGTVNSVGRVLIDAPVALGIIPTGSGNGFARHFEIPLAPERAVEALANAAVKTIDVGLVNGHPFLVTCSMAWEAAIAQAFERSPLRGIVPYIFAGMQEFLVYHAQDLRVTLDDGAPLAFEKPMVFTIANLTQYGGGARIAPDAQADDGQLELVVALRQDIPMLIANVGRLFDGSLTKLPQVATHRFRKMRIERAEATPIQVDGELLDSGTTITVAVRPASLRVLVPVSKRSD